MMNLNHAASAAGSSKGLRVLSLLGGAVLMLAGTVPSQAAITPNNVDPMQHILDCAKAMLSNPAEHAQFCSPGHAEALTFQSSFVWTGPTKTTTPPPPLVELCDGVPCDFIGN